MADLLGGTTGQILAKNSNTNMDFVWITNDVGDITAVTAGTGISGGGSSGAVTITNSMATEIDAKGDLIGGTGADTFARLAVGANGTVLTADSTETTGLKWVAAGAGAVTKISTTTFSAVASQNFEGVFTSTYQFYTIMMDNVIGSGTPDLQISLLYSTNTEQTATYYGGFYGAQQNGTYTSLGNSNTAFINLGRLNNVAGNGNFISIDMGGVGNSSVCPTGVVQVYSVGNGPSYGGSIHNETARTYTGLKLFPASGTITGTVSIYGWSK
jgi:hypothetical protein